MDEATGVSSQGDVAAGSEAAEAGDGRRGGGRRRRGGGGRRLRGGRARASRYLTVGLYFFRYSIDSSRYVCVRVCVCACARACVRV